MRRPRADAAELDRLRKENKRLKLENEILEKASAFFCLKGSEDMTHRHAFVAAHKTVYPISQLCRIIGIARSWFYDFVQSQLSSMFASGAWPG